jgi:hypothetical protein
MEDFDALKAQKSYISKTQEVLEKTISNLGETEFKETDRAKVFISYARPDADWAEQLRSYLRDLSKEELLEVFDDSQIDPSQKWWAQVEKALEEARVVVLLVSQAFFESAFVQIPYIINRANLEEIKVLPVIISPSNYQESPLVQIEPVNPFTQPLVEMAPREQTEVLYRVVREVREAISSVRVIKQYQENITRLGNINEQIKRYESLPREAYPRTKLFIGCGKRESRWLREVQNQLSPLAYNPIIEVWDEHEASPEWVGKLRDELKITKVALVLIDPNTLTDDYTLTVAMPPLLEENLQDGASVLLIPVAPPEQEVTVLRQFEWAEAPSKPLNRMSRDNQTKYFYNLTYVVEKSLKS